MSEHPMFLWIYEGPDDRDLVVMWVAPSTELRIEDGEAELLGIPSADVHKWIESYNKYPDAWERIA